MLSGAVYLGHGGRCPAFIYKAYFLVSSLTNYHSHPHDSKIPMDALNERFGVRHPFPVAPGPPNRPLDHWERADMLNVELIALGW